MKQGEAPTQAGVEAKLFAKPSDSPLLLLKVL